MRAALTAKQAEALRRHAEQARALLDAGAIGEAEHKLLLAMFWQLIEADRSANAARTQMALEALNGLLGLADAGPLQGEDMDANVIMKQIEMASAVMKAQLDALNGVAPSAPAIAAGTQTAASVLDASLQANWVGLGHSLAAMAQAECEVRGSFPPPPKNRGEPLASDVIDIEAREVPAATPQGKD